jgi:hypothetical protein
MTGCIYTWHDRQMPKPATGRTPAHSLRAAVPVWFPALARAEEEDTTITEAVVTFLEEWGMGGGAGRDLDYARWPEARTWAAGHTEALAALRSDLEASLGPVPPDWLAVAAWLAASRHPGDPRQQQRIITGRILRRAAADPRPQWLERNRDTARLADVAQQILKRHLPLHEA